MTRFAPYMLAAVSAALTTLSFPPFHGGILAWVGLTPLLFALRLAGSGREAACLGLLFGFTFNMACHWSSLKVIDVPVLTLMSLLASLYSTAFAWTYRQVAQWKMSWLTLLAPSIWVALELVRVNLFFLSWPWSLLGHTQHANLRVIQIVDLTGVYGVSFIIVMINQAVSELAKVLRLESPGVLRTELLYAARGAAVRLLVPGMVLLAVLSYGSYRLAAPKQEGSLRIALVQANRIVQDRMPMGEQQAHLEAYEALTREASGMVPDLIVWPASSLPSPMIKGGYVFRRVTQLAKETGCRLLVGGAGYEKMKALHERRATYANNELLVTPSGAIEAQYNKIKLVPFNEEIPLEGKVPWPQWVTPLKQSFTAGSSFTLFSVGEARFGTPICWENYFPDFFRKFMASGANLMVSVTNDSFFGPTEGQYQTLAMNVFRAVENRVTVVRSTPTGVSAFIGPDGQIVERVRDSTGKDLFVAGCLVREIPLNNRKTFYTMHGDAFAGSVSLIAAVGVMAAFRVSFRVRPPLRGTAGAELRSE